MHSQPRGGPRFQEQIVVLEQRIAQALFEQTWWQATGDTVRRQEADMRVEVLQLQLALRQQQRPP
jgi:hypothetical protein